MRRTRTSILIGVITTTLTLVACSPVPSGDGPVMDTPDEPSAPSAPGALIDLDCDALASADAISTALNPAVVRADWPLDAGGVWPLAQVGLQQLGTLRCAFSDEASQQGDYPVTLEITALPHAADAWANWQEELASWSTPADYTGASFENCASSLGGSYHYCHIDALAGDTWAHIRVSNTTDFDAARALAADVIAALSAAAVLDAEWVRPASGITAPLDCDTLLDLPTIRAATGADDMDVRERPLNMPVLYNVLVPGALACSWSNPYSSAEAKPLDVSVIPGAGWAWDDAWAAPREDRNPADMVAGLGDAAYKGCMTDQPSCFVDVLLGEAWISVSGTQGIGVDGLREIAVEVVRSLRT